MFLSLSFQGYITDLSKSYLNDDHKYQIRTLYTPLFCNMIGKITRPMHWTHSGLGFVDESTGQEFTIEYNINPINYTLDVKDAFVPHASFNKTTGMYDFKWNIQVRTYMQDLINVSECGWEWQTVVANHVSGKTINEFIKTFGKKYGEDMYIYQLLELWFTDNHEKYKNLRSNSCQDFIWWGMQDLAKRGVKFNDKLSQRLRLYYRLDRDLPEPKELIPSNKEDNKRIYEFYQKLNQVLSTYNDYDIVEAYQNGEILSAMKLRWPELKFVISLENRFWDVDTDEFVIGINNEDEKVPGTD